MKTIEELALEHGDTCYQGQDYHFSKCQLEALCKDYMQDRLKSLEPVAWNLRCQDWKPYTAFNQKYHWASDSKPLYDISSLLEKDK